MTSFEEEERSEPKGELVDIAGFVGSFLSLHAAKQTIIASAKKKGRSFRIISPPIKNLGAVVNNG